MEKKNNWKTIFKQYGMSPLITIGKATHATHYT